MRSSWSTVALLALPATTLAVSLSDFTPRVSNLPPRCKAVYTQTVDGCSSTDFGQGGCSEACVEGLQAIAADVKSACGNKDITGQNIIVAYLAGSGPSSLCPNAAAILGGSGSSSSDSDSSTSTPSTSASSPPSSSSSTSSMPSSTKASATSTTASSTETVSSLTTAPASSTGLLVDTSSTPSSGSVSSSSQTDDGQSGGGSPFDTPSNGAALPSSPIAAIMAAAMMLSILVR
ncbi:hypothetical protein HII31_02965 [Pseudocercospora fuligena]|uniref:Extracellular membrane protein CFEM domain-containing protein n=1 Tax=Pseudocercospora fuligena TaxID=685502 RepID=A0A8H6RQZ9_9PEZI|nr:hypothetical protein HII31_02965 [Pseudocercospora fuligena]